MAKFDALQKLIPKPPQGWDAWEAISTYAACLAAQGEAARALPLLLAERASVGTGTATPSGGRYLDLALGDIYQQLGRFDEARHALQTSFDGYVAAEAADRQTRMKATERWARFLVDHGGVDTAERLFREVLAQDHDRHLAHAALAQAGLARVALARGQASVALAASAAAMKRWADVRGFRDVRMGAYIARVQARAQLAAGDRQGARTTAETALAESLRYDVPEAASIAEARELLAQSK
jgi:serine/threonine-protein kinase